MATTIFETIDRDRHFLRKWLPFVDATKQVTDTESFLKTAVKQRHKRRDDIYGMWYKEEFAGLVAFKETDWFNHKTELGYWVAEKMQGKGIVTSAVKVLLRYSFQKLKMNRVQIKVAVGNEKSAAIPKRLGFKFEGIERQGEFHFHKYVDLEIYSMLKKEWQQLH